MRIHSKFKDYYDSALGYGIDEQCHYVRQIDEHKKPDSKTGKIPSVFDDWSHLLSYDDIPFISSFRREGDIVKTGRILVSFCGRKYFGLNVVIDKKNYEYEEKMCWTIEDFDEVVENHGTKKQKELWASTKKKKDRHAFSWYRGDAYLFNRPYMNDIYAMNGVEDQKLIDMHHALEVPVVMREGDTIVLNPVLSEISFYRVKDAFQAFQDISMFISGVLGGNSPKMVELTNDERIAKHGFDNRSFRKDPESK